MCDPPGTSHRPRPRAVHRMAGDPGLPVRGNQGEGAVGPGAPRCVVPTKVPVPPCGAPARLATGDPSPGDQPEQYSSRAHPGAHSAARHLAPVRGGKKDHSISWATPHATNNHIADGKPCLCLLLCFALHRHNPCQLTQMTPLHGPLPCKACLAGTLSHIEFPTRPLFLSPLCTTPEPPSLSYSLTCPSVVSRSVIWSAAGC